MSKRADEVPGCSTGTGKHIKTGIDAKWNEDFHWMLVAEEGEGMLCSLCRKHSRRLAKARVGRAVWVDVPCRTLTRLSLVKHAKCNSHLFAVQMKADLCSAKKDGGIAMSLQQVVSAQRKAFIGALKCMYFLTHREIPHKTNFVPLLELSKSLGASYLSDLHVGGNAHYTSKRCVQELLQCLSDTVAEPISQNMQQSPFFALCVDETTDVSVTKELIVYSRYLVGGEVITSFLKIMGLFNGTAVTIADAVSKLCTDLNLDMLHCFCGLGSDGASVMLGRKGGVSKILRDKVPFLVSNHCIAHRLALACGQAANEIPYLKKFKDVLDQLYRFYKKSPVRTAGLKEIQEVLHDDRVNLVQATDVRWLLHDKAVSHLRKSFPSVLVSLEREAQERSSAEAAGLASFLKKYEFIAALYMFSDILPPLACLSRAFKKQNIDFTMVKPLVQGTKETIDKLLLNAGDYFQSLPAALNDLQQYGIQQPRGNMAENFKKNVYNKYLGILNDHISARFPDVSLLEGFEIFNPSKVPRDLSLQARHGVDKLEVLLAHYGAHNVVDPDSARQELKIFNSVVASNLELKKMSTHELMGHLLKVSELKLMFPNLYKLAAIGLLLPMSSVDCERGFSTLSRVKTDLRSRLSNKNLNHLLMISIEGPCPSDFPYDTACDKWAAMRSRRINVEL